LLSSHPACLHTGGASGPAGQAGAQQPHAAAPPAPDRPPPPRWPPGALQLHPHDHSTRSHPRHQLLTRAPSSHTQAAPPLGTSLTTGKKALSAKTLFSVPPLGVRVGCLACVRRRRQPQLSVQPPLQPPNSLSRHLGSVSSPIGHCHRPPPLLDAACTPPLMQPGCHSPTSACPHGRTCRRCCLRTGADCVAPSRAYGSAPLFVASHALFLPPALTRYARDLCDREVVWHHVKSGRCPAPHNNQSPASLPHMLSGHPRVVSSASPHDMAALKGSALLAGVEALFQSTENIVIAAFQVEGGGILGAPLGISAPRQAEHCRQQPTRACITRAALRTRCLLFLTAHAGACRGRHRPRSCPTAQSQRGRSC
jgi:hypothetical protein